MHLGMGELQELLVKYNRTHKGFGSGWHKQFMSIPFPYYWQKVYELMDGFDRDLRVVEIGCGYADILSCVCGLGFKSIVGFERDKSISQLAVRKVEDLFCRSGVVIDFDFRNSPVGCDVLLMVNCVYADVAKTKEEYCSAIQSFVEMAGNPRHVIYEAIDDSFVGEHTAYPDIVRLSESDIATTFPDRAVRNWRTYSTPHNKTDKRLYHLERKVE